MDKVYTLDSSVAFWAVDREQRLSLPALFQLFQEAAIKHADLYNVGSAAMLERGESWVLNRLSAQIHRYPAFEEAIRIRTWSTGIRGFRGFRELRLLAGDKLLASASTHWLYVDMRTKALTRVPAALAQAFPEHHDEVFHPGIEHLKLSTPTEEAKACSLSLRYSDIDSNGHVNNAAYFDYLQTALSRNGLPTAPHKIAVHFLREIPPTLHELTLHTSASETAAQISIGSPDETFALAEMSLGKG